MLCVGPRRLRVNPIYSQHTRGGGKGPNNVHNFEKYLRHGVTNVATIYGPVTFGKQPCILLKENEGSQGAQSLALAVNAFLRWIGLPPSSRLGGDGDFPPSGHDADHR